MAMQIEPGRYVAAIRSHSLTQAKSGTLQLAFVVEILGRVDPSDPENMDTANAGMTRTIFRPITENTSRWVWDDLDRLGFTGDEFVALDEAQAASAGIEFVSLAGKQTYVRCKADTYEGVEKESWGFDNNGGGPNLQAADQSKVREANAMFSRKKVQQKSGKPTAAAKVPAGQDIPF